MHAYLLIHHLEVLVLSCSVGVDGLPVALVGDVAAEAGLLQAVVVGLDAGVGHPSVGAVLSNDAGDEGLHEAVVHVPQELDGFLSEGCPVGDGVHLVAVGVGVGLAVALGAAVQEERLRTAIEVAVLFIGVTVYK